MDPAAPDHATPERMPSFPEHHPEDLGPGSPLRPVVTLAGERFTWARGVRAALAVGIPFALVTGVSGELDGVSAALGGYAVLYAANEPYARRARVLAAVGLGLAAALALGSLAAVNSWVAVVVLTFVAAVATFLTGALQVDRPGGFTITLVAAVGTFLPYDPGDIPRRVVLLLVGAGTAWLVSMSGWLARPHHPEHAAIADGFRALSAFLDSIGRGPTDVARHKASQSVHRAWMIVRHADSRRRRGNPANRRLAVLTRRLVDLFQAAELLAETSTRTVPDVYADTALGLAAAVGRPELTPDAPPPPAPPEWPDWEELPDEAAVSRVTTAALAERHLAARMQAAVQAAGQPRPAKGEGVPGPRPSPAALLRAAFDRGSLIPPLALRTGAAVGAATCAAQFLPLLHPSWVAIGAAAALQGGNVALDFGRALQRAIGTFLGFAVVAIFFHNLHPGEWATVAFVTLLFGAAQTVMTRSLVLGQAIITPSALMLAGAGIPGAQVGDLAATRLLDTLLGLGIGLVASLLVWRRAGAGRLPAMLARAIRAEAEMLHRTVTGPVTEDTAWVRVRQRLRRELLDLWTVYDASLGELAPARTGPERLWPALVIVQRLGYRLMTVPLRRRAPAEAGVPAHEPEPLEPDDVARVDAYLAELADAAETRRTPAPPELPDLWGYPVARQHLKRLTVALAEGAVDTEAAVWGQPLWEALRLRRHDHAGQSSVRPGPLKQEKT